MSSNEQKFDMSQFTRGAARLWDGLYGEFAEDEISFLLDVWKQYDVRVPARILDIGCGTGRFLVPLKEMGFNIQGIDNSEGMLAILKQKAKKKNLNPDVELLDFKDFETIEQYDSILAFYSLIYLLSDEEIEIAFSKIYQLLRPAGVLIFNFFNVFEAWQGKKSWGSHVAKTFESGHIRVEYHNTPEDLLRGVVKVEDFRFLNDGGRINSDYSVRRIRFFSMSEMRLFLRIVAFEDIRAYPGFIFRQIQPKNRKGFLVTMAARKPKGFIDD